MDKGQKLFNFDTAKALVLKIIKSDKVDEEWIFALHTCLEDWENKYEYIFQTMQGDLGLPDQLPTLTDQVKYTVKHEGWVLEVFNRVNIQGKEFEFGFTF